MTDHPAYTIILHSVLQMTSPEQMK